MYGHKNTHPSKLYTQYEHIVCLRIHINETRWEPGINKNENMKYIPTTLEIKIRGQVTHTILCVAPTARPLVRANQSCDHTTAWLPRGLDSERGVEIDLLAAAWATLDDRSLPPLRPPPGPEVPSAAPWPPGPPPGRPSSRPLSNEEFPDADRAVEALCCSRLPPGEADLAGALPPECTYADPGLLVALEPALATAAAEENGVTLPAAAVGSDFPGGRHATRWRTRESIRNNCMRRIGQICLLSI